MMIVNGVPVTTIVTNKIKEVKADNIFSLLFWDTASLEKIQKRSGEVGEYVHEWQFHYISLVGRILTESGQVFDIGFPLVAYNYPQKTTAASIDFHLNEVSAAGENAMKLVDEQIVKLQETNIYKKIISLFPDIDWMVIKLNSIHAHPGNTGLVFNKAKADASLVFCNKKTFTGYKKHGLTTFSSIDLNTDLTSPGVVYPFTSGDNLPTFAGIMQHRERYAEIVRSEYRIFREHNDEKIYYHGKNLTLIRGFEEEDPSPLPSTFLNEFFNFENPVPSPAKLRPSYTLVDDIGSNFSEYVLDMFKIWREEDSAYSVNAELIFEENIGLEPEGYVNKRKTFNGYGVKNHYTNNVKKDTNIKNNISIFSQLDLTGEHQTVMMLTQEELSSILKEISHNENDFKHLSQYQLATKLINAFNNGAPYLKKKIAIIMIEKYMEEELDKNLGDDDVFALFEGFFVTIDE